VKKLYSLKEVEAPPEPKVLFRSIRPVCCYLTILHAMAHSKSIVDHFWVVLPTILRRSSNDFAITVEEPLVEDTEEDPEDDFGKDTRH
jgi:hypothetical protein